MRKVVGLATIKHEAPSRIDLATLRLSHGRLPESFLRGYGLSDHEIETSRLYQPDLSEDEITDTLYRVAHLRGRSPIQIHPVFISYSHYDADFVDVLEKKLEKAGIRYWRDIHDLVAGRIESQIDRAMRLNPIVIVVLSEHSVESDWVEWETEKARALEKELGRDVLCPVAIDGAWKTCQWSGPLRSQIQKYYVMDLSARNERQMEKLIDGLRLHYAK